MDEKQNIRRLEEQFDALHDEIGILSKKSPNDAVNKFKLDLINKLLLQANEILPDDYLPLAGFTAFEEDSVPTNSDVTVVLAQYCAALLRFRIEY